MSETPDWARDPQRQVLSERRDGVLLLTLNRPERLNAWTPAMEERLFDLLEEADGDPRVRAIVVTGAGRGFCAGADMEALAALDPASFRHGRRPMSMPVGVRKPVIAAVNGAVAGVGLVAALFADLRFVARDAKITTAFSRRGLIAEYGIAWQLPRLVGTSRALDLLLSSRIVLGEEAERIGLADRVLPREEVLEAALEYAGELARSCSPMSMATIKAQVYRGLETGLEEAAREAAELMPGAFASPDFHEGVAAFLERRPAAFPGLPAGE
ncbi:enoyl-CoA hydratase-related protein [Marinactinospora endophytica]